MQLLLCGFRISLDGVVVLCFVPNKNEGIQEGGTRSH